MQARKALVIVWHAIPRPGAEQVGLFDPARKGASLTFLLRQTPSARKFGFVVWDLKFGETLTSRRLREPNFSPEYWTKIEELGRFPYRQSEVIVAQMGTNHRQRQEDAHDQSSEGEIVTWETLEALQGRLASRNLDEVSLKALRQQAVQSFLRGPHVFEREKAHA